MGQEYVSCLLWPEGTEVAGRTGRMGVIKSAGYIFKTGIILLIFQMRKLKLMEVKLYSQQVSEARIKDKLGLTPFPFSM